MIKDCRTKAAANILQWIIRWASMLLNRYHRGIDGRTAYHRIREKDCQMHIAEFVEMVDYKQLGVGEHGPKLKGEIH